MKKEDLIKRDSRAVWHPYTQMMLEPCAVPVVRGEGLYLYGAGGEKYMDAISSWWVTVHGHCHSHIIQKLNEQFRKLDQVMFAGFTHEPAVELAERILKKLGPEQRRFFFSDNGSTAVEVALKMVFQYWHNRGAKKNRLIALEGAYHGDTFGSMSASARSTFTQPFSSFLFGVTFIPFPSAGSEEETYRALERELQRGDVAGFIFEPLVQGVSGMRMYLPEALDKLMTLCRTYEVLCIADEVMTGFGRTGRFFAMDHCACKPDIFCFSKGITGGVLPLGATTCTEKIYEAFLSDDRTKTFFHGHSYTANPLACSAANASLDVFDFNNYNFFIFNEKYSLFKEKVDDNKKIKEVRFLGTIMAVELYDQQASYFSSIREKATRYFMSRNILIRPLGNIIYIMPPYCITEDELSLLLNEVEGFLSQW